MQVNNAAGGIVPFDKFYIPCIQQKINIQHDYQNFIRSQVRRFDLSLLFFLLLLSSSFSFSYGLL